MASFCHNHLLQPTQHAIYKSGAGVPLLGGYLTFTGQRTLKGISHNYFLGFLSPQANHMPVSYLYYFISDT